MIKHIYGKNQVTQAQLMFHLIKIHSNSIRLIIEYNLNIIFEAHKNFEKIK